MLSCFDGLCTTQRGGDDVFLKQFSEQRDGEVDEAWAASYAHAEELLRSCRSYAKGKGNAANDDVGEDARGFPILFRKKWRDSFTQPCKTFAKQLRLLRAHWQGMEVTLEKLDEQRQYDEYKEATVEIVTKVIEDHYRGLLQLQVFQYWHRGLYERCLETLGARRSRFLQSEAWWVDKAALEFRKQGTLKKEMMRVVSRYAEFTTHIACDKLGVDRDTERYRVKTEEAEAVLSRRRIAKDGSDQEVWLFGHFAGVSVVFLFVVGCSLFATPIPTYNADDHLWEVLPYFRGFFVFYVAALLWGYCLHDMERDRVNYPYLLGLSGEAIQALHVLRIACLLSAFGFSMFALYLLEVRNGLSVLPPGVSPRWYIVANFWFPFCVLLWPFQRYSLVPFRTRRWLIATIASVALTPFIPVTFAGNFVTDYMTSMVKVLLDLAMTTCVIFSGDLWEPRRVVCVPGNTSLGASRATNLFRNAALCCTLIPLAWRWLQCARKAVIEPFVLAGRGPLDATAAGASLVASGGGDGDVEADVGAGAPQSAAAALRQPILGSFTVDRASTVLKVELESDEVYVPADKGRFLNAVCDGDSFKEKAQDHLEQLRERQQQRLLLTFHDEAVWLLPYNVAECADAEAEGSLEETFFVGGEDGAAEEVEVTDPSILALRCETSQPPLTCFASPSPSVRGRKKKNPAWENMRAKLLKLEETRAGEAAALQLRDRIRQAEAAAGVAYTYYMCHLKTPEEPGVLTIVPVRYEGAGADLRVVEVALMFHEDLHMSQLSSDTAAAAGTGTAAFAAGGSVGGNSGRRSAASLRSISQKVGREAVEDNKRRAQQRSDEANGKDKVGGGGDGSGFFLNFAAGVTKQRLMREGRPADTRLRMARRVVGGYSFFPHVYNMVKYTFSILPILVALAFEGRWGDGGGGLSLTHGLYFFLLVASTAYSFCWDILVDWGLWKRQAFPSLGRVPLRCARGWEWRPTPHGEGYYAGLMLFNLAGRCAWAITLVVDLRVLGVTGRAAAQMLTLITAVVEVVRRSIWARLRLGHEQTVDVGHYRAGEGYHNVPPLLSKKTPWTVPGEFSVLRTFKLDTTHLHMAGSPAAAKEAELEEGPVSPAPEFGSGSDGLFRAVGRRSAAPSMWEIIKQNKRKIGTMTPDPA